MSKEPGIAQINYTVQRLERECRIVCQPIWDAMARLYRVYLPKLVVSADLKIMDTIWPDEMKEQLAALQSAADAIVASYKKEAEKYV